MNYQELKNQYNAVQYSGKTKAVDDAASFVEQRFYAMTYAKQPTREIWQGVQNLYYCNDWEWIVTGEDFIKPIRFPTLRDFIKALTDTFMQDPPDVILRAKYEDEEALAIGKKAFLDDLRNSSPEKTVRRQVIEDMFFYGKGFRDVNCFWTGESKELGTRRIDPRDFFVDESAQRLHAPFVEDRARDIVIRHLMPLSSYMRMAKELRFRTEGVQAEPFFQQKGLDYTVTNSRETIEKSPVYYVKLYEYLNQELDKAIYTASGQTVYEDSMKACKGSSHFTVADYTFEPRNDSYWAICLGQLLAAHIFAKDTTFNLEFRNMQLTLQPVIAMSGDFGYNPRVHVAQPGGVWTAGGQLNGKISDHIMPLTFGNPNTRSYEMLQNINSELAVTARADLRSFSETVRRTATEIVRNNQSMNVHNETIENINEVEAECVLWNRASEVMISFLDEKNNKGFKRKVPIKGYVVSRSELGKPSFLEKSGYEDVFDLTQDIIDYDCEIIAEDKRSLVAKNIEKVGRVMQALPVIGNIAQLDPAVLQKVDFLGLIEQLVEVIGLDLDRSVKQGKNQYDDEFELIKQEIMLGNKVECPEESREESIARLKYLAQLEKQIELTVAQCDALQYHLESTFRNITANHIERKIKEEQAMNNVMATAPELPAGAEKAGEQVMQQRMKQQQIKQPNTGVLDVAGPVANNLY